MGQRRSLRIYLLFIPQKASFSCIKSELKDKRFITTLKRSVVKRSLKLVSVIGLKVLRDDERAE